VVFGPLGQEKCPLVLWLDIGIGKKRRYLNGKTSEAADFTLSFIRDVL
jgi:hypothetical protein